MKFRCSFLLLSLWLAMPHSSVSAAVGASNLGDPSLPPRSLCPPSTVVAKHDGHDDREYCICAGDRQMCIGPMCQAGHVISQPGRFVSGYVSTCFSCRCVPIPSDIETFFKVSVWSSQLMYYHVHVSKTGGTTLERQLHAIVAANQVSHGVTMCKTEKHPFTTPPFFADPATLVTSGCNVVTAEGRMEHINEQFPGTRPLLLALLRHPVLRTISQWNHDSKYGNKKAGTQVSKHYTMGYSSLLEYFDNVEGPYRNARYGDWQTTLLSEPGKTMPEAIDDFAWVGITEYYKTSMCLFYFTFQMQALFHNCQNRTVRVYNAACTPEREAAGECSGSFANLETEPKPEDDPHVQLQRSLDNIDPELKSAVEENVQGDLALYRRAMDLFWRRVAVMEQMSGILFSDLPREYRRKDR